MFWAVALELCRVQRKASPPSSCASIKIIFISPELFDVESQFSSAQSAMSWGRDYIAECGIVKDIRFKLNNSVTQTVTSQIICQLQPTSAVAVR